VPELPDLVRVESVLRRVLTGRTVEGAQVGDPTVLRVTVRDPFPACLVAHRVLSVDRRGQFMRFGFSGDLALVVNPMLAGRFVLCAPPDLAPPPATRAGTMPKSAALVLHLEGGVALGYVDDKRMGKLYVAGPAEEAAIPVYADLGVEVLSDAFTPDTFRALVRKRRDQVRMFLMDKRALSAIGNAYADEILFRARIHPKTFCGKLAPAEVDALYAAIGGVLREACAEIERRGQPIDVKVRDFLAVRGRAGQPCPACGTTIRAVRVGGGDACFCPRCQPASRRLFVDWGKLPAG
jgi:formamidopyrimidine-DNA glycosylase